MNLRLKAYDLKLKTLVAMTTTLIVLTANAAVEDYREQTNDIVEQHVPIEVDRPYREHRRNHGILFGLNYENTQMYNYVSIADFTTPFADMFGDIEIPIYNLYLSYKYNFLLGALTANLGGGYGTYTSSDSGILRTLSFAKYSASASYIADTIFKEPFVAPYVTFGANQFDITEGAGEEAYSAGVQLAYFYTAGLLIQLNWLDEAVSKKSLVDYGLENTYLDVFVSQFQPSIDPDDPNTETEYTFGAGMRLEF
ncbi:MAG: hypothetical protein IPM97_17160 [Bdellovibrionaceae bacterium]|nr:hypothetical protein [Pseudobdellovibrionaceae bacterium]